MPAGALPPPVDVAGRLPGDGSAPPPDIGNHPANPFVLTELLTGASVPAGAAGEAIVAHVLGAPIASLLTRGELARPDALLAQAIARGAQRGHMALAQAMLRDHLPVTKSAGAINIGQPIASAKLTTVLDNSKIAVRPVVDPESPASTDDPSASWLAAMGLDCYGWGNLSSYERMRQLARAHIADTNAGDMLDSWCRTHPDEMRKSPAKIEQNDAGRRGAEDLERLIGHDPNACADWLQMLASDQIRDVQTREAVPLAEVASGGDAAYVRYATYQFCQQKYDTCDGPHPPGWNGPVPDRVRTDDAPSARVAWVRTASLGRGAIVTDPIQGAVGDCYLISALSGIAWVHPGAIERIAVSVRPGVAAVTIAGTTREYSERVPVAILSAYAPVFARSSRGDSNWPGIAEKAYSAWRSHDATDRPNITLNENSLTESLPGAGHAAGGRSSIAVPQYDFLGGEIEWFLLNIRSASACYDVVRRFCDPGTGRATAVLTAGTRDSDDVNVSRLVRNHMYTVLGATTGSDGRRAIILRNPWGRYTPDGTNIVPFAGRWQGLNVSGEYHGVFALDVEVFAVYFATVFGVR